MTTSEWEKIIANETSDKGFISKIYKQLIQLDIRKANNPIKKIGGRPKQTFLQRRHADGPQTHAKMFNLAHYSVQLLNCVRLSHPMNCSMPGLPVHQQLSEFTETHVH